MTNLNHISGELPTIRHSSRQLSAMQSILLSLGLSMVCFFATLNLLSPVQWPQYLDYPAAKALPHLANHLDILQKGYWLYELSVLCTIPLVITASETVSARWGKASIGLGIAVVAFKSLGIGRWLFAMPYLIQTYSRATDPFVRQSLEIQYEVLNRYAGGIGEQFGVALFTGLWIATLTAGSIHHASRWRFATMGVGVCVILTWIAELFLDAAAQETGAIVTTGSIAVWVFLVLFAVSGRKIAGISTERN